MGKEITHVKVNLKKGPTTLRCHPDTNKKGESVLRLSNGQCLPANPVIGESYIGVKVLELYGPGELAATHKENQQRNEYVKSVEAEQRRREKGSFLNEHGGKILKWRRNKGSLEVLHQWVEFRTSQRERFMNTKSGTGEIAGGFSGKSPDLDSYVENKEYTVTRKKWKPCEFSALPPKIQEEVEKEGF